MHLSLCMDFNLLVNINVPCVLIFLQAECFHLDRVFVRSLSALTLALGDWLLLWCG